MALLTLHDDEAFWLATHLRGDESLFVAPFMMLLRPRLLLTLIKEGRTYRRPPYADDTGEPRKGEDGKPERHPLLIDQVPESDLWVLRSIVVGTDWRTAKTWKGYPVAGLFERLDALLLKEYEEDLASGKDFNAIAQSDQDRRADTQPDAGTAAPS